MQLIMNILDIASTLAHIPLLSRLKKGLVFRPDEFPDCFGMRVQLNAKRVPERTAIIFEGKTFTWFEFNALANRYAHYGISIGLKRGDAVSVMMENRTEFLALLVGFNKIGVISSLLNTNLTGESLAHCVVVSKSLKIIFGSEVEPSVRELRGQLTLNQERDFLVVPDGSNNDGTDWAVNLSAGATSASSIDPEDSLCTVIGETALFIFTSGTTGLPKAAVLSNRRFLTAAAMSSMAGLKCTEKDRLYLCLPLYHGTGVMVGMGASWTSGASIFLRRKFSASHFLQEVRDNGCNCFVYVGEICRYLMNTESLKTDGDNPLRAMIGNGLRPDVWLDFKRRFKVKRIMEFYGASEGNVFFGNLMNKDCTVGMTTNEVVLVDYDIKEDEIRRTEDGLCGQVGDGEPGLLLGKITETSVFEGYTDQEASNKKIVRDVVEKGDAWFNSGDLLRTVNAGFTLGYPHYQFVDRIGDTFRWKSENVSTNEVGEIINGFSDVKLANVYGVEVPGVEGRAGMAAITLSENIDELDTNGLYRHLSDALPSYAIPVFLRIQHSIDVTGTFKMKKGDLREEAYDIRAYDEPVFVLLRGENHYRRLDIDMLELIESGSASF